MGKSLTFPSLRGAKLQKFKHSEPAPELITRIPLRDVRRRLSELIARTRHHGTKVVIRSHGKPVAAIVSMADYERCMNYELLQRYGPHDPITGSAKGWRWVEENGWVPGMYWGPGMGEVEGEVEAPPEAPKPRRRLGWFRRGMGKGGE